MPNPGGPEASTARAEVTGGHERLHVAESIRAIARQFEPVVLIIPANRAKRGSVRGRIRGSGAGSELSPTGAAGGVAVGSTADANKETGDVGFGEVEVPSGLVLRPQRRVDG